MTELYMADDVRELPLRYSITNVEVRLLVGVAEGLTNRRLARRHIVSESTVRSQLSQLIRKFHAEDGQTSPAARSRRDS